MDSQITAITAAIKGVKWTPNVFGGVDILYAAYGNYPRAPRLRLALDDTDLQVHLFEGHVCTGSMRFDSGIPTVVVTSAVATAVDEVTQTTWSASVGRRISRAV